MPAVNGICSLQHDFMLTILPYEINLYDLALCIDNNDKHMTFRAYTVVYFICVPHTIICTQCSTRAQMMLLRPQVNYMPSKSHAGLSYCHKDISLCGHT